jgi:pilus assembly protein CpaB
MTRNRLALIGLVALALAGFVSFQMYRVLNGALNASRVNTLTTVVAAANDVPAGTRLNESDLRLVKMRMTDLPPGSFHTVSEAVGRAVMLPLSKGEPVLQAKLAALNGGSGMPALIPSGMRAVSVKVNDVIAVAGFVTAGTRVDVLLTGQPSRIGDNDPAVTTVLENVQVLAAGQKLQNGSPAEPQQATVITLLVSPEDAQKLALATQEGKIQLALRNPLDDDKTSVAAIRNSQLYGAVHAQPVTEARKEHSEVRHAKAVRPAAPEPFVVELIRGDKRDSAKFDQPKPEQRDAQ